VPELPEVERTRLTLEPFLVARLITRATLARGRRDIVTGPARPADLLQGRTITELRRKGKQLAIIAEAESQSPSRMLLVHLGMSGQLFHLPPGARPEQPDHIHARWELTEASTGSPAGTLIFRDPRRFGGLWTLDSPAALGTHWQTLGPDALNDDISSAIADLARSGRAIKAALLDQQVLAGVGNIYADESLHLAGINPTRPCRTLGDAERDRLARAIPTILRRALSAGGSTLRDYRDGTGASGTAQTLHAVYGRASLPCLACASPLRSAQIAQRTTVWCARCQA
jgi:formamidopyrimidine-DNA glycosylase